MSAKLAIVIPAYNAEKGLERSTRSVLGQTLRDLELWITDDGSTDGTAALADRLAAEDPRVHVIHQPNSGCYQARLNALKRIDAKYFGFVDADDIVEPTMFEEMVALAEEHSLDAVECGHIIESGGRTIGTEGCDEGPQLLLSRAEVLSAVVRPCYIQGQGAAFVWNKVYRNQFDFAAFDPTDRDTTFEDMIFNLQFFKRIERMGFLRKPLYHYIINEGSSVKNFSQKTLHDFCECLRVRREQLPFYGVDPNGETNQRWIMRNARNAIITAAISTKKPLAERVALVEAILRVPDIRKCPKSASLLALVWLPKRLVIMIICALAKMKGMR